MKSILPFAFFLLHQCTSHSLMSYFHGLQSHPLLRQPIRGQLGGLYPPIRGDVEVVCICPSYPDPVCGQDGKEYLNQCQVKCANTHIACSGPCPCTPLSAKPETCTTFCPKPPPPPPKECFTEDEGQQEDEDAFIVDSCEERHKKNTQRFIRKFCFQICDALHHPGITAVGVLG